jgi:hypothetical protein
LKHFAAPSFWQNYRQLPPNIQKMADESYGRLKANPRHPSLHFKQIGRFRSVRVGFHHRALAVEVPEGLIWFWIGTHGQYQRIIKKEG